LLRYAKQSNFIYQALSGNHAWLFYKTLGKFSPRGRASLGLNKKKEEELQRA
jgi:hypothetical protein